LRRIDAAPGAPGPLGSYNLAVVHAGVVYVAGQVAVDEAGELVGGDDPLAQARQAYANLDAVLRAAGSDLTRLLKLTVFLTDMRHSEAAARARREFVPAEAFPASTLVQVSSLAHPSWLIEVEAMAALAEP
jgi:enamine deaminase RidA (YjgF/YER057c/UK114 family)